jgi:hypothetical protein
MRLCVREWQSHVVPRLSAGCPLTGWAPGDRRARRGFSVAEWFRPQRWSQYDIVIAVSALALAVSPFVPWFTATVRIKGSSLTGFVVDPPPPASGLAVHSYLWAVFAVGLLEFAVLASRYVPDRRAFTVPGYRQLLVALGALTSIAVLVAGVMKPSTWNNLTGLPPNFYVTVGWDYGALIAFGAAIVSVGFGIAAIRDAPPQARANRWR